MSERPLSDFDLRAFLRTCQTLLADRVSDGSWTAFQKYLLLSGRAEFGLYLRQLKKLDAETHRAILDGFTNGQIESKLWLIEVLGHVLPACPERTHILGSWFGLLGRMIAWMRPGFQRIDSYDLDPRWKAVADFLAEPDHEILFHRTRDMREIDYADLKKETRSLLVINTSCEHLEDFDGWFRSLPSGLLVALQANDFEEPEEHHTIWKSVRDFGKSAPLETVLYEGELQLLPYRRFMLIGVTA
ncbi:MAG TPA: hypothetical protein PL182_11245 [Pseudobdellovibrionaceae bacterium]|nr:hypothetical protein [Pseudobdellovibrionaceae bacterium]